jgi:hypothetical protein
MHGASIKLAIAILLIVVACVVANTVLPRLGLSVGFEGGMMIQGLTIAVGFIIAGGVCCVGTVQAWRALRTSTSRRIVGYIVLGCSALIALSGFVFVVTLLWGTLMPMT